MAIATNQDEILYCARCGISFVWSREEQKAPDAAQPRHCPACRYLLPAPGRERGLIKWYDRKKHYGFIVRAGQPDLYVHRTSLDGQRLPRPGDLVEFSVQESPRGPVAQSVVIGEPAAATGSA